MSLEVVFIHLGNPIPKYLFNNLKRHSQLFPSIRTTLILSSEIYIPERLSGVNFYIYENTFSREIARISKLNLRTTFRNNFWLLSLERLLVLSEFHKRNPEHSLLHIESDILLMPNFPWAKFTTLDTLYWSKYEPNRDVAALLFSPSVKESEWLNSTIFELCNMNPDHTDMTVLSEIDRLFKSKINLLPTMTPLMPEMFNEQSDITGKYREMTSTNFTLFNGIFDPAAIGIWLCGTDPRNHYGVSKIHFNEILEKGKNFIDPAKINYSIDNDGNLFLVNKETQISLFNLHIHSKNPNLFDENWQQELQRFISMSDKKNQRFLFSFMSLRNELIMNLRQRTLIRYLLSVPFLYKYLKILKNYLT